MTLFNKKFNKKSIYSLLIVTFIVIISSCSETPANSDPAPEPDHTKEHLLKVLSEVPVTIMDTSVNPAVKVGEMKFDADGSMTFTPITINPPLNIPFQKINADVLKNIHESSNHLYSNLHNTGTDFYVKSDASSYLISDNAIIARFIMIESAGVKSTIDIVAVMATEKEVTVKVYPFFAQSAVFTNSNNNNYKNNEILVAQQDILEKLKVDPTGNATMSSKATSTIAKVTFNHTKNSVYLFKGTVTSKAELLKKSADDAAKITKLTTTINNIDIAKLTADITTANKAVTDKQKEVVTTTAAANAHPGDKSFENVKNTIIGELTAFKADAKAKADALVQAKIDLAKAKVDKATLTAEKTDIDKTLSALP